MRSAGRSSSRLIRAGAYWSAAVIVPLPMDESSLLDLAGTFDGLYGLEILEYSDEHVRAQVPVRDQIKQPAGLVHGGVFASIAESITSMATAQAVLRRRHDGHGPVQPDDLPAARSRRAPSTRTRAAATAGRTTWVWEVDITDDAGPAVRAGADDDRRAAAAPSAAVAVRDRHPPVAAERLRRDLDPRRLLAALVLGQVDEADDAVDVLRGQAAGDELLAAEVLLDVALEDRVEHLVGRQRVLVALVGAQLGRRRPRDDRLGDREARVAACALARRAGRRAASGSP